MNVNFEEISKNLFNTEISKIPEPHRSEFVKVVKGMQVRLESQLHTGTAGAGLLTITADSQGAIKGVDIDKTLVQKRTDNDVEYTEFNQLISDLIVIAHKEAIENAKKSLDKELVALQTEVLRLANQILSEKSS